MLLKESRLDWISWPVEYLGRASLSRPATVVRQLRKTFNKKRLRKVFLLFCRVGSLEIITRLSNVVDRITSKAFITLCGNGHLECVRWMFEKYNLKEIRTLNALHLACKNGHLETAKWLVDAFIITTDHLRRSENKALRTACIDGKVEIVRWLHSRFELNAEDARTLNYEALYGAAAHGHNEILAILFDTFKLTLEDARSNRCQALRSACTHGHLSTAKFMFEKCELTPPDASKYDLFKMSCEYGQLNILKWLVDLMKATDSCWGQLGEYVPSPSSWDFMKNWGLILATEHGHVDVVEWLLTCTPSIGVVKMNDRWEYAIIRSCEHHERGKAIRALIKEHVNFDRNPLSWF